MFNKIKKVILGGTIVNPPLSGNIAVAQLPVMPNNPAITIPMSGFYNPFRPNFNLVTGQLPSPLNPVDPIITGQINITQPLIVKTRSSS